MYGKGGKGRLYYGLTMEQHSFKGHSIVKRSVERLDDNYT